jgi:hypothetical protein
MEVQVFTDAVHAWSNDFPDHCGTYTFRDGVFKPDPELPAGTTYVCMATADMFVLKTATEAVLWTEADGFLLRVDVDMDQEHTILPDLTHPYHLYVMAQGVVKHATLNRIEATGIEATDIEATDIMTFNSTQFKVCGDRFAYMYAVCYMGMFSETGFYGTPVPAHTGYSVLSSVTPSVYLHSSTARDTVLMTESTKKPLHFALQANFPPFNYHVAADVPGCGLTLYLLDNTTLVTVSHHGFITSIDELVESFPLEEDTVLHVDPFYGAHVLINHRTVDPVNAVPEVLLLATAADVLALPSLDRVSQDMFDMFAGRTPLVLQDVQFHNRQIVNRAYNGISEKNREHALRMLENPGHCVYAIRMGGAVIAVAAIVCTPGSAVWEVSECSGYDLCDYIFTCLMRKSVALSWSAFLRVPRLPENQSWPGAIVQEDTSVMLTRLPPWDHHNVDLLGLGGSTARALDMIRARFNLRPEPSVAASTASTALGACLELFLQVENQDPNGLPDAVDFIEPALAFFLDPMERLPTNNVRFRVGNVMRPLLSCLAGHPLGRRFKSRKVRAALQVLATTRGENNASWRSPSYGLPHAAWFIIAAVLGRTLEVFSRSPIQRHVFLPGKAFFKGWNLDCTALDRTRLYVDTKMLYCNILS